MKSLLPIIIFLALLAGSAFAQHFADDSVAISITIRSCEMSFFLDSLPHSWYSTDTAAICTFYVAEIYSGFLDTFYLLDWEATYIVGNLMNVAGNPYLDALRIIDDGCVPLDFELSTYAKELPSGDTNWWQPNDTTTIETDKYILRTIATGRGTFQIPMGDSVNFKSPESYYYIVTRTPKEILRRVIGDSVVCCFYSHLGGLALYGYDSILTIDTAGVNLQSQRSDPDSTLSYFYLHMAITTPRERGSDGSRREGIIILHIMGKARRY